MKQVTVKFRAGRVEVETSGFTGDACKVATDRFLRELGGSVESETPKPEAAETAVDQAGETHVEQW